MITFVVIIAILVVYAIATLCWHLINDGDADHLEVIACQLVGAYRHAFQAYRYKKSECYSSGHRFIRLIGCGMWRVLQLQGHPHRYLKLNVYKGLRGEFIICSEFYYDHDYNYFEEFSCSAIYDLRSTYFSTLRGRFYRSGDKSVVICYVPPCDIVRIVEKAFPDMYFIWRSELNYTRKDFYGYETPIPWTYYI